MVVGAAYLALIPAARALGLPSAAAIGAQAILVTGPLMIGILMVSRRRRPEEPAIALRRVPTVAATLGWAAVILCAAAAAFVLTRPVTAWLERTLFQAWPPLAHAVLFAFYHVWTLWLTPTRILAVLPLIYITLRTRSILPAMVAHVVLNLIDVVLILAVVIRPG